MMSEAEKITTGIVVRFQNFPISTKVIFARKSEYCNNFVPFTHFHSNQKRKRHFFASSGQTTGYISGQ